MIIKKIQKYGNSLVLRFDRQEIIFFNLKEGDLLDIGEFRKVKKGDKNVKGSKIK